VEVANAVRLFYVLYILYILSDRTNTSYLSSFTAASSRLNSIPSSQWDLPPPFLVPHCQWSFLRPVTGLSVRVILAHAVSFLFSITCYFIPYITDSVDYCSIIVTTPTSSPLYSRLVHSKNIRWSCQFLDRQPVRLPEDSSLPPLNEVSICSLRIVHATFSHAPLALRFVNFNFAT
jgi:hypothetical protein